MRHMWKSVFLLLVLITLGCGYKVVSWSDENWQTMAVRPIEGDPSGQVMRLRLRDALIERCLAGSGLRPTDHSGDLILTGKLLSYSERVIATDTDGRTQRLQFNLRASFKLKNKDGETIWELKNYQYSNQYSITTSQASFRDESVLEQDDAMKNIADLVITNITLAIHEWERIHE